MWYKYRSSHLVAILRRVLFVCVLLGTGSIVAVETGAYAHDRDHPFSLCGGSNGPSLSILVLYRHITGQSGLWISWLFPYEVFHYVTLFIWGIDFSLGIVLGTWLVARQGWWLTWVGRCRAILYSAAFTYGSMLTVATQRWLHSLAPNGWPRSAIAPGSLYADYPMRFHFPGTQFNDYYNDYSRPATDLLLMFAALLVLIPVFTACRFRLGSSNEAKQFSIFRLLLWTALFAISLGFIRFLCGWVAPATVFSNLDTTLAFAEFFYGLVPATFLPCIAIMMIATGKPTRGWQTFLCIIGLLVMDSVGSLLLSWFTESSVVTRCENPLAGSGRWAFQLARVSTIWIAFSMAAALGVSFKPESVKPRKYG